MEYIIPFASLSYSKHNYNFEIKDSFFERYQDESNIKGGEIQVNLVLERKTTFLILEFDIQGTTKVECDRCLDSLDVDIQDNCKLYVKFGYSQVEDPDVIFISPDDNDLDVRQIIYELISLNIPIRNVHPDDENGESTCNQEMLELLDYHSYPDDIEEEKETDPRWDKLSSLLN